MKQFHDILVRHAAGGGEQAHTRANKKVYEFAVDKGLVTWAGVYYPRGCRGCVYSQMYFQAHQILPRNVEDWMHGEGGWWGGAMYLPVDAAPLKFKVISFQEPPTGGSVCYDHTITAAVEFMPFDQVPAWDKVILRFDRLLRILGVKP